MTAKWQRHPVKSKDRIMHSANLESFPPFIMTNLCHDKDSSGRNVVLAPMMSEPTAKNLPFLELPVDSLMPCSGRRHLPMVFQSFGIQWNVTLDILVGSISHDLLTRTKHLLSSVSEDREIIGCSTGKGAIETNNVSSENANCNLIPKSRLVEFLSIPPFAERNRLLNQEVSAINSNQASITLVIAISTVPSYLKGDRG